MLSRLRGMFAFAVLDTRELPCLLLARDRVGVKPLYYYQDGDAMIFASEVRALVKSELVQSMQASSDSDHKLVEAVGARCAGSV